MSCNVMRWVLVVAALFSVGVGRAWAFPPSNPYKPTAAGIQGMLDRTSDFSGGSQASTNVKSDIPGGMQLDVTWSTGAAFVNETFTRTVRSQRFPDDNGDGDGGDLDAFDGVAWLFRSDTPIAVKPYSQSWDNFNFQEGNQPTTGCGAGVICVPGGNVPTVVSIDWNMVGGSFPAADRTNVFELGWQIFGPSLPQDGSTARSIVRITTLVPEPGALALVSLTGVALIGLRNRRRRGSELAR
jgi:hypothetical protein